MLHLETLHPAAPWAHPSRLCHPPPLWPHQARREPSGLFTGTQRNPAPPMRSSNCCCWKRAVVQNPVTACPPQRFSRAPLLPNLLEIPWPNHPDTPMNSVPPCSNSSFYQDQISSPAPTPKPTQRASPQNPSLHLLLPGRGGPVSPHQLTAAATACAADSSPPPCRRSQRARRRTQTEVHMMTAHHRTPYRKQMSNKYIYSTANRAEWALMNWYIDNMEHGITYHKSSGSQPFPIGCCVDKRTIP